VAYAISRPARAPEGTYYEVAASPRGDLLKYQSETGPQTWFSLLPGFLGFATFLVNRVVFHNMWRVIVRPAPESRLVGPGDGVMLQRDVKQRLVDNTVDDLVRDIESGQLDPLAAEASPR
jgi:hypothetical protein